LNSITVLGRLAAAPEKKQSQNGKEYYTFSVASNSKKNGEEKTTWYRSTIFNFNDKFMHYLKPGSSVVVIGTLGEPRIYQDKQGENKVSLDIVVNSINFSPFGADKKEDSNQSYGQRSQEGRGQAETSYDDGLPF
jgi:single stranded DNA-binding protein